MCHVMSGWSSLVGIQEINQRLKGAFCCYVVLLISLCAFILKRLRTYSPVMELWFCIILNIMKDVISGSTPSHHPLLYAGYIPSAHFYSWSSKEWVDFRIISIFLCPLLQVPSASKKRLRGVIRRYILWPEIACMIYSTRIHYSPFIECNMYFVMWNNVYVWYSPDTLVAWPLVSHAHAHAHAIILDFHT